MRDVVSIFVPGRLCLFGEHSDWAGRYMSQNADLVEGRAIVSGINLGIYADARMSESFTIISLDDNDSFTCEMNVDVLKMWATKSFTFSYCCGVAAYMKENFHVGGVCIKLTKVTLPMKKGLSSSAAICCLVVRAFNELYHLHISTKGIMNAAYRGELLTGSRCGRMDQACAYGERPVLMHFNNDEIDVEALNVGKTLYWVIVDLCAGKNTKKILTYLSKAYPFAVDEKERREQEALGLENHIIINRAKRAIEDGDAQELGRIMNDAQTLFDEKIAPMCPDELTAPVLHSILNDSNVRKLTYGGKGVGSQGDGTAQLLARDELTQKTLVEYLNNSRKMSAVPFTMNVGGKVRKAIIPIAGFGTRMFPETFFVKKAFLPIINGNGIVKPVLVQLLEELDEAGIEEIFLIVGENEVEEYERFFGANLSTSFLLKLPENLRPMYHKIVEIGKKVRFIVQQQKLGLGHAVYQARKNLKGEPVIVLLGDFVYTSNSPMSCVQQTIEAYNLCGGKDVVSIKQVSCEDACHYGILHGEFDKDNSNIMLVDNMVEKPNTSIAEKELAINNECYATFGQYVLTDSVFKFIEGQIAELEKKQQANTNCREIDLTDALKARAMENGLVGVKIDGISYDVGIPEKYYDSFVHFREKAK